MEEKEQRTKAILVIVSSLLAVLLIAIGIAFAIQGIRQVSCKHVWDEGVTVTEPTCYEEGELKFTCDKCDKTQSKSIDLVSHTWQYVDPKEPTCTEDGHRAYTICTVCNSYKENEKPEVVPATGHTEVETEAVAPSCTERGITAGKYCTVCGKNTVKQEILPALGHSIVTTEGVAPTCTASGVEQGQYCERCETVYWGCEELPALGHNIVTIEGVAPTCTESGKTEEKICSICSRIVSHAKRISPLGHDYSNGNQCVNCGERKNISLYDLKSGDNLYGYKLVLVATAQEILDILNEFVIYDFGFYVYDGNGADIELISLSGNQFYCEVLIYGKRAIYVDDEGNAENHEIILNEELGFTSYIIEEIGYELPVEAREAILSLFEFVYVGE